MKYAFCILMFCFCHFKTAYAKTITSFSDSDAITTVTQFLIDNAEDMPTAVRLSDKLLTIKDAEKKCVEVTPEQVLKDVQSALGGIFRLYPDEELPIDEAMSDLSDYLGAGPFKKCLLNQNNAHIKMNTSYFSNEANTIHVKVDKITLIAE